MKRFRNSEYYISEHGDIFKNNNPLYKYITKKGYIKYRLSIKSQRYYMYAHRAVYETYIGKLNSSLQINHIDGNKMNNHYSNLEQISCMDNIHHAIKNKLRKTNTDTKYSTIHRSNGKFVVERAIYENKIYVGAYNTLEEAKHSLDTKKLNYSEPYLKKQSLDKIFTSKIITRGDNVKLFENKVSDYVQSQYSIMLPNATIGLYLVNKYIKSNIELVTNTVSPITFMASANASELAGIPVYFNDIESIHNPNMKKDITTNMTTLVHYAGVPIEDINCDIVIEDAAHSFGSKYLDGSMVGCCKNSLATIFSFHAVKNITTMEGGIVTTNSKELYEYLIKMRNHGIEDSNYTLNEISLNYNVTEAQAILGLQQFNLIDEIRDRKLFISEFYKKYLNYETINITNQTLQHIYPILCDKENMKQKLNKLGINTVSHYIPVNNLEYYKNHNGATPIAEEYYSKTLSIPFHMNLKDQDLKYIILAINENLSI